jgi:capsular exopolysaccharide synthesis family protein
LPGLTDVILGNYQWRDVIRSITDLMMGKMTAEEVMTTPGLDNLYIMTCGTIAPNPSELVNTKVNSDILAEVHGEYDFVIIDAPPVLAATDAAIWGTKADGVVLVYQVGKIARGALKRAKAQIDNVRARIIGVVLNGLKAEISPDYEYHDKYYYYYGSERKKQLTWKEKILAWRERAKSFALASLTKKRAPDAVTNKKVVTDSSQDQSGRSTKRVRLLLLMVALLLLAAGWFFTTAPKKQPDSVAGPANVLMKVVPPQSEPAQTEERREDPNVVTPSAGGTVVSPSALRNAEPSSPLSRSLDTTEKRFVIQVRATQDKRIAEDTVNALKMRGHESYWEEVDLREKGLWQRIFVGPFVSEEEARRYLREEKLLAVYPDFIIRREGR